MTHRLTKIYWGLYEDRIPQFTQATVSEDRKHYTVHRLDYLLEGWREPVSIIYKEDLDKALPNETSFFSKDISRVIGFLEQQIAATLREIEEERLKCQQQLNYLAKLRRQHNKGGA